MGSACAAELSLTGAGDHGGQLLATALSLKPTLTLDMDLEACKRNVDVQQLLARINMVSQTAGGILGALTVAAWSSFSDRAGRCRVLAFAVLGLTVKELCFYIVLLYPQSMVSTGGAVLYAGPIFDGLFGGTPLLNAVWTAYLADVVPVDRIPINAVGLNAVAAVVAMVFPLVGPFLVKHTSSRYVHRQAPLNARLLPFEATLVLQVLLTLFVTFVVPESLRNAPERKHTAAPFQLTSVPPPGRQGFAVDVARRSMRRLFSPLRSLAVFLPRSRGPGFPKDWNMLCLATVFFLISLARVSASHCAAADAI